MSEPTTQEVELANARRNWRRAEYECTRLRIEITALRLALDVMSDPAGARFAVLTSFRAGQKAVRDRYEYEIAEVERISRDGMDYPAAGDYHAHVLAAMVLLRERLEVVR